MVVDDCANQGTVELNVNTHLSALPRFGFVPASVSIKKIEAIPRFSSEIPKDTFYFSADSTRAKLDRFLNTAKPASTLLFNFVTAPGASPKDSSHVALILEYKKVKDPILGKSTAEGQSKNAYRLDVVLKRQDYNRVVDARLLSEARALNASKLPLQKKTGSPNVLQTPEGQLIVKSQFKALEIKKDTREWAKRLLTQLDKFSQTTIGQYLTRHISPLLRLENKETLVFFNRWRFNPVHTWRDKTENPLKPFNLVRLPNGTLGDVTSAKTIKTFIGSEMGLAEASLKRMVKDRVLLAMEEVETQDYSLIIDTVQPAVPLAIPSFKPFSSQVRLANPFAGITIEREEKKNPAT